jgi:hypothetical protein
MEFVMRFCFADMQIAVFTIQKHQPFFGKIVAYPSFSNRRNVLGVESIAAYKMKDS